MKLKEILEAYQTQYLPTIITQVKFRSCIKQLLARLPGDAEVSDINFQTLLNYRQDCRAGGLAEASINKYLSALGSALKWAKASGLTTHEVKIPRVREVPHNESLSEDQIQLLLDSAPNLETKSFIALLFITGQRKSAVQQLKWSQIRNGIIEFERDGYEKAGRRKRRARTPVTAKLSGIFRTLHKAFGRNEYVIPGPNGIGYCKQLDRWFEDAAYAAKIDATPHLIRHTTATVCLAGGASLFEVSSVLGHSSTAITERVYVQRRPEHIATAVGSLGSKVKL